jgi:uncharacterized YccA/Bax inhibitor family protein
VRTGITLAWLAGMGIIGYQSVAREHHAPLPGRLIGASGLFGLLALVSEYQPAAGLAAVLAWGFDLAALLNVLPGGLGGVPKQAPSSAQRATGTTQAPGTSTAAGRG